MDPTDKIPLRHGALAAIAEDIGVLFPGISGFWCGPQTQCEAISAGTDVPYALVREAPQVDGSDPGTKEIILEELMYLLVCVSECSRESWKQGMWLVDIRDTTAIDVVQEWLDRNTMHLKFEPIGVWTCDLQIMNSTIYVPEMLVSTTQPSGLFAHADAHYW